MKGVNREWSETPLKAGNYLSLRNRTGDGGLVPPSAGYDTEDSEGVR